MPEPTAADRAAAEKAAADRAAANKASTKPTRGSRAKAASDTPTAEVNRELLNPTPEQIEQKLEKDPPEAQEQHADWSKGREPTDVVEVEGQRETVEARMARGGVQKKVPGTTTLN